MQALRHKRPWIKVQLSVNACAEEAAALVKSWKTQRQAAAHVVRAVRLYAALCQGDLSLLEAYFPGLRLNGHASYPAPVSPPSLPAPTVKLVERSEAEDLDEALAGLGLDGLDFGR
jgi:hypothetical protein